MVPRPRVSTKSSSGAGAVFVGALIAAVLSLLLSSFIFMLAAGALHKSFDVVPAFSFGQSILVLILARCLIPQSTKSD